MTEDEIDNQEIQDSLLIPYRPAMQTQLFTDSNVSTGANLSPCQRYRFTLWRIWDRSKPVMMFIGLNPSTADANNDDRTINRCISFARAWGYGGFYMMNLFCFRATKPVVMKRAVNPVGEDANSWLHRIASKCDLIVFAWGCDGEYLNRDKEVIELFPNAYCLGKTKDGHPKHPLFLPALTPLEPFN